MPELPEVETIKRELEPYLIGQVFTGVAVYDPRLVQKISLEEFCTNLIGQKIVGLARRGKFIIFHLSGNYALIVHLRMTGSLLWNPCNGTKFTRAIFYFENSGRLVYADIRRFGTMFLVKDVNEVVYMLGVEPLGRNFTSSALVKLLHKRNAPVKAVLLDQRLVAGIGNMYADEALFAAKIHPARPAGKLAKSEIDSLHKSIVVVLKKAIENKGASIRNYRCPDGRKGTAQEKFAVAHREGKTCPECSSQIVRIVVRQRGTYYCPKCQKKK